MEKNKRLLKFALFVVVLLAVAVALLRILAYNASSMQAEKARKQDINDIYISHED